jgi:hypothetical protein
MEACLPAGREMAIHGALPRSATIHDDPFESIFRKALSEISARYSPGALRYGERRFPSVNPVRKDRALTPPLIRSQCLLFIASPA